MAGRRCVLAIDQGTTSSRAVLYNEKAQQINAAQQEFPQIYPEDGWVEHDPDQIWESVINVARQMVDYAAANDLTIEALGISNQRETTILWDRKTGKPIYNAIVWQDRRTSDTCDQLRSDALEQDIQNRSGLLLDPYFSATKVSWILDHVSGARERAEKGEIAFGTVDSFLIWHLTGGRQHLTDVTNASRTNLFNIEQLSWDDELLKLFRVPRAVLPEVKENCADFGLTCADTLGAALPILGVAGDQQAASIGQCCFNPGEIKSTYGTGGFLLLNTGEQIMRSSQRLLSTIAYQIDGKPTYALEGSIFIAGAAVQWLRDEMGIIKDAAETETLARSLANNGGVYLVPAFTGLGVPHWRPDVRGAVFGLTRGSGRAHFARAALESVCYQTADLFKAMAAECIRPTSLRVDGGMVANHWMLQFLADVLDTEVLHPAILETTALGAAYLAGRSSGLYGDFADFHETWQWQERFEPQMAADERNKLLQGWQHAVHRVVAEEH